MAKEGVDPVLLSELTGRRVIQLAWGGRGVSEQALYWELFLERHECQTLLLELHPRGLERGVLPHPLDEFRYVARLGNPIIARHLIRHFGWLRTAAWKFVPMWAMAEFSTQIGWHDLLAIRRDESFEPNAPPDNQHTATQDDLYLQRHDPSRLPGATAIDPLAVGQFADILAACKEHHIEVIGFVPPIFEADSALNDLVASRYRDQLQIPENVFRPVGDYLSEGNYFQDAFHVNDQGSRQFTRGLAEFLMDGEN